MGVVKGKYRDCDESALGPQVGFSLGLHLIAFLAVPLVAFFSARQVRYERPRTFQLVSAPTPRKTSAPPAAVPPPRESVAKPRPQPAVPQRPATAQKPKPAPAQREEAAEDLSELASILEALATPAQVTPLTSDFAYPWFLRMVEGKIRSFWRPPYENERISVTVQFDITGNGDISGLRVTHSSGDPALDNLALRAVTLAAPFGRLPPRYAGGNLTVSCKLVPTRK